MEKNAKLGFAALGLLLAGTFAAHAAYARRNASARPAVFEERDSRALLPALATEPASTGPAIAAEPGALRVEAKVDRTAVLQRGDGYVHVQVTLDTHGLGVGQRTPTDFVVVFDRSGSMSGSKIEYGRQALRQLVERMNDEDRFALVTYESGVEVRVPLAETARERRREWLRAVNALETAGGTNIAAGLEAGLAELVRARQPSRASRVLLLSDGLATEGETSVEALVGRAQRIARQDSVLGAVGIGADFDERMMTSLARGGAGAFYYLAKLEALSPLLDAELKNASDTYAQGAELVMNLPSEVRLVSASGAFSVRRGAELVIPVGSLYGEHSRTLWLTLQVPTAELRETAIGGIALRYRRDGRLFEARSDALPSIACVSDEGEFQRRVVESVWEHAMLEEEIGNGTEALGDAIRSGEADDVHKAVARANSELSLAKALGNQRVVGGLQQLSSSAAAARVAQGSAPSVRARAAKKATADGFGSRNASAYRNFEFFAGY